MIEHCSICNKKTLARSTRHYQKCFSCGHEFFRGKPKDAFIVNDILKAEEVYSFGSLDRFREKTVKQCMKNNRFILDVGSASGKFLYHIRKLFKSHLGIEVTDQCIAFSRSLGLNIDKNINNIGKTKISVLSFWHVLEHIETDKIQNLFTALNKNFDRDTKTIISVPNSGSLMYKMFKEHFAYYDSYSHHHQFSTQSLDKLMTKFGFKRESYHFSLAYTLFGYLQSFMNCFNKIHNFYYYSKKRGNTFGLSLQKLVLLRLYNVILVGIFLIPSLFLAIYDALFKQSSGVITVCYGKK